MASNSRTISLDLHTHSLEKKINPKKYWKVAEQKKLDAIAITEHVEYNPRKGYHRVADVKPDNGIVLIPGMELYTTLGHVICLGKSESLYDDQRLWKKPLPIGEALDLAKEHDALLSIAHPWGFELDSAAFRMGPEFVRNLVKEGKIGVEAYNGMIGNVSDFLLKSNWVRKPVNFLQRLDRNRVARKLGVTKVTNKVWKKYDKKSFEMARRSMAPFLLGEGARFVTAGSDAHYPERIGTGLLKLKVKEDFTLTNENALDCLLEKNVAWAGPETVEQSPGVFVQRKPSIEFRREILGGLKYATTSYGRERIKRALLRRKKKSA